MTGGMTMGGPMMVMGLLVMVLFFALVIAGVVWLVQLQTRGRQGRQTDAISQLEWRYARGEIDRDEYLQRRNDLVGS